MNGSISNCKSFNSNLIILRSQKKRHNKSVLLKMNWTGGNLTKFKRKPSKKLQEKLKIEQYIRRKQMDKQRENIQKTKRENCQPSYVLKNSTHSFLDQSLFTINSNQNLPPPFVDSGTNDLVDSNVNIIDWIKNTRKLINNTQVNFIKFFNVFLML